jgi:hypothetical protein
MSISGLLILGLMLGVGALAHQSGPEPFQAKAVSHTATIRLNRPVDKVFPLFGPVRESDWAPGWSPELIYPTNTDVAEGMVFKVEGETGLGFWVITRYDPGQHTVAYVNLTPGHMVNRILIACSSAGDETDATITYWHVALDERGNDFVQHMDAPAYAAKMAHWQQAIKYRLETGKTIPAHHQ